MVEIDSMIDEEIGRIANEIFTQSQENLVNPEEESGRGFIISDTGELLISGDVRRLGECDWEIRYTAPHAIWVEYGTDPHYPPLDPLIKWAKHKLQKNDKEAVSIACMIRNKIAKEGTEPRYFLTQAVSSVMAKEKLL
jgi:hypothetical protein